MIQICFLVQNSVAHQSKGKMHYGIDYFFSKLIRGAGVKDSAFLVPGQEAKSLRWDTQFPSFGKTTRRINN